MRDRRPRYQQRKRGRSREKGPLRLRRHSPKPSVVPFWIFLCYVKTTFPGLVTGPLTRDLGRDTSSEVPFLRTSAARPMDLTLTLGPERKCLLQYDSCARLS